MKVIDLICEKFREHNLGNTDCWIQEDSEWIDISSETNDFTHLFDELEEGYVLFAISYNKNSHEYSGNFSWLGEDILFYAENSLNLDSVFNSLKENWELFLNSTGAFGD